MRTMLPTLAALSGSLAFAGAVAAADPTWTATRADTRIEINRAVDTQFGVSIEPVGARRLANRVDYRRWRDDAHGALVFRIEHGHYAYPAGGGLDGVVVAFRVGSREATVALRLVPQPNLRGVVALVDARGDAWLTARDVHQLFDAEAGALTMTHLDLRVGPALARWLGAADVDGQVVGALHLALEGEPLPALAKGSAQCGSLVTPDWPQTSPGTTDVVISEMGSLTVFCPAISQTEGRCDGSGTDPLATLKFLPSVKLRNNGTTDVPWYLKFSTAVPPAGSGYPYATLDQHPFLVWNVYRIEADGRFDQIGRSGIKHAFFTGNEDCACTGGAILYYGPRLDENEDVPPIQSMQQCADTYDAMSNDIPQQLGPRRELLASQGIFGRCGSVFDPDCDGIQNQQDPNPERDELQYRAPIRESELVAALHPGARYFIEAWYVIRDDANLYNTMVNREFVPTFNTTWTMGFVQSDALPNGAAIDRWVAPASTAPDARNTEVATSKGRLKLAVRVVALPESRWRYDYAVMNFDYADATTSGAEPNVRVLSNPGIGAVRIPVPATTATTSSEFSDGGTSAADDWTGSRGAGELAFTAAAGNTLDWGSMYRFSFVANAAPVDGSVTLDPADATAADLVVATIVPGAAAILFADGFEDP